LLGRSGRGRSAGGGALGRPAGVPVFGLGYRRRPRGAGRPGGGVRFSGSRPGVRRATAVAL